MYVPVARYSWLTSRPEATVPSPKFHEWLTIVLPSATHDPDPSKVHTSPSHPRDTGDGIGRGDNAHTGLLPKVSAVNHRM